jgi:transposase
MRQVRDVLRLKTAGVAINEIARRVGVASSTVRLTLKRLAAAGLGWPLPAEMTDTVLEEQLFTAVGKKQGHRRLAEPDWVTVHRELKRKQARHAADPVGRVHRAPPRRLPLLALL